MKDRIERTQWMVGAVVGEKLEKGKVFCSVMLLTHMLRWYCCGAHSMYGMCVVVIVHQVSSRWRSQNGDVGTLGLSYCTVRNEEDGKNNKKDRLQKKTRWPCVRMTTYNVDEWEKCNKYGTDCEWAAYNRTTPVRCDGPEPQQPKSMDPPQNKVLLAGNGW